MKNLTKSNLKNIIKPFSCALILTIASLSTHAQTCKTDSIIATIPDSRFEVINGGSEVKDKITGLIWQRCSVGQTWNGNSCTGTATTHTWQQALTVAKNLGNGYRLPNIEELESIVEHQCHSPAINQTIFPDTPNNDDYYYYWSSSTNVHFSYHAWGVNFYYGHDGNKYKLNSHYVRAVRSESR